VKTVQQPARVLSIPAVTSLTRRPKACLFWVLCGSRPPMLPRPGHW
jgi:hypothetical protein